jgi:mannose-6-phosphate isomerase-like protein (cupin superfamily)
MKEPRNYRTLDGSNINELVHPRHDPVTRLSLAQATVAPGRRTYAHIHKTGEEIYYTISGEGQLHLDNRIQPMQPGSVHLIRPGQNHWVQALTAAPLSFLCACSPPYTDEDTELVGPVEV